MRVVRRVAETLPASATNPSSSPWVQLAESSKGSRASIAAAAALPRGCVIHEGILMKSPTRSSAAGPGGSGLMTSPPPETASINVNTNANGNGNGSSAKESTAAAAVGNAAAAAASAANRARRESLTWVKSKLGTWQRRLFRLHDNGVLDYFDAVPFGSVSLTSTVGSTVVCLDQVLAAQPQRYQRHLLTVWGIDAPPPAELPSDTLPQLSDVARRMSKLWNGVWSSASAVVGGGSSTATANANANADEAGGAAPGAAPKKNSGGTSHPPPPAAAAPTEHAIADEDDDDDDDGPAMDDEEHGITRKPPTGTASGLLTLGFASESERLSVARQIAAYASWFASTSRQTLARTKIVCRGWMWKKGTHAFSVWKPRFFVLLTSRELTYFLEESGHALGTIDLSTLSSSAQIRVVAAPADAPQAPTTSTAASRIIEIETPGRTWKLSPMPTDKTDKPMSLDQWASILKSVVEGAYDERPPSTSSGSRTSLAANSSSRLFAMDAPPTRPDVSPGGGEERVPIVERTRWQRISGNVPMQCLSPSPLKAMLVLANAPPSTTNAIANANAAPRPPQPASPSSSGVPPVPQRRTLGARQLSSGSSAPSPAPSPRPALGAVPASAPSSSSSSTSKHQPSVQL